MCPLRSQTAVRGGSFIEFIHKMVLQSLYSLKPPAKKVSYIYEGLVADLSIIYNFLRFETMVHQARKYIKSYIPFL